MSRDYISTRDADFDDFFKFMNQYVAQKCSGQTPEWTHIPQAARTLMADSYIDWYTAYANTVGPHTPEDTSAKNDAKDASRKVIRPFVNQYLRYPPVTKQDREAMGIPNRDEKPTPIPPPELQVEADLIFPGIHLVELVHIRPVGIAVPDPRSDYGVRIYYGLTGPVTQKYQFRLASLPRTGADLPYSVFTRRKKQRFDFDGESGTTVYFCLRYENPTGKAGPFGPILNAVIP